MTDKQRKTELYRASNIEAASIVAPRTQDRYPGTMQQWAAMVLTKTESRVVSHETQED